MFFCLALPVFCYIHSMEHLLDLIRKRQSPGILIIDRNGQLRYSNQEVLVLLPNLLETDREGNPQANIPAEILRICTVANGTTAADENGLLQDITTNCSLMSGG